MNVIVKMEIETNDYSGKEFKNEIEKLIIDIDNNSKLTKFEMYKEHGIWNCEKDIEWGEGEI